MAVKWVERFQIYVLNVGNLAAGASATPDLPLLTDSDAPFCLRGRGGRVQNDPRFFQAGMNGLLTRFRDPRGNYSSDALVPWFMDVPFNGYGGAWKPHYPEWVYPPQAPILTDISNTGPGAVDLVNLQLYFVGVKRYPPNSPYLTYPQQCSTKDFIYSYWSKSPTNPQWAFQNALMGPSETRNYIPITIQADADFVLRSGQVGVYGSQELPWFYMELFILLMDQQKKPYMNAPVHVDWLFGGGSKPPVNTEGNCYLPNNTQNIFQSLPALSSGLIPGQTPLVGNWHPGLIYPELYWPANSNFYFNLIRNDASYTEAFNPDGSHTAITVPDVNIHIAFTGSKVYKR